MTTPLTPDSMSEEEAVRALERLARRWPKSLWLFSNGNLYVLRKDDSGKRMVCPRGGMDPESVIAIIDIESDGGDW